MIGNINLYTIAALNVNGVELPTLWPSFHSKHRLFKQLLLSCFYNWPHSLFIALLWSAISQYSSAEVTANSSGNEYQIWFRRIFYEALRQSLVGPLLSHWITSLTHRRPWSAPWGDLALPRCPVYEMVVRIWCPPYPNYYFSIPYLQSHNT